MVEADEVWLKWRHTEQSEVDWFDLLGVCGDFLLSSRNCRSISFHTDLCVVVWNCASVHSVSNVQVYIYHARTQQYRRHSCNKMQNAKSQCDADSLLNTFIEELIWTNAWNMRSLLTSLSFWRMDRIKNYVWMLVLKVPRPERCQQGIELRARCMRKPVHAIHNHGE